MAKVLSRQLRHVITLQAPVRTRSNDGQSQTTWADKATVRAYIEPLSGREFFRAEQMQVSVSHRVTLRSHPGITPDWRFVFSGRVFHIASARSTDNERGQWIELMCEEVQ